MSLINRKNRGGTILYDLKEAQQESDRHLENYLKLEKKVKSVGPTNEH